MLDAEDLATAPWRLAWSLHGVPTPTPPAEHRDLLVAFADRFGPADLIAGLRIAAKMPAPHGSGLDPSSFETLARRVSLRVAS